MRLIEKIAQAGKIPGIAQSIESVIRQAGKGKDKYFHAKIKKSKQALTTAVS